MNRIAVLAVVACCLSGCQPPPPPQMAWYKVGISNAEFQRDQYECMREAAQTYPTTAGTTGIVDRNGGMIGSYDINSGNRNSAESACMRVRGWQLIPQGSAPPVPTATPIAASPQPTGNAVLTCKANIMTATPSSPLKQINGGVLRIEVGRSVVNVTMAEGGTVSYRVSGLHDSMVVASRQDPDGDQYDVHVSVSQRDFAMMRVSHGQPVETIMGPCQ